VMLLYTATMAIGVGFQLLPTVFACQIQGLEERNSGFSSMSAWICSGPYRLKVRNFLLVRMRVFLVGDIG
jgi:hypothetical protein